MCPSWSQPPPRLAETDPRHALLYVINEAQSDPFDVLDAHFGARVDHWLYIPDPRGVAPDPSARVTVCPWPLGQAPYDSTTLDPAALMVALEEALKAHADGMEGKRVGIAIADCSAVMRFVQNPAKHVQMERTWHDNVSRLWAQYLRTAPAIDVCVYRDDDIDALGLTIDRLATTLELVERHDLVCVLSSGTRSHRRATSGPHDPRECSAGRRQLIILGKTGGGHLGWTRHHQQEVVVNVCQRRVRPRWARSDRSEASALAGGGRRTTPQQTQPRQPTPPSPRRGGCRPRRHHRRQR